MSESTELRRLRESVDSSRLATGRRATELSREGRYLEAAALLERDLATFPALLAPFAGPEAQALLERWTKWQHEGLAVLRQRHAWTTRASTELAACKALLVDLLEASRWDVDRAEVTDPRVQVLLDAARSLDLGAMRLFSDHHVRVVIEAPALTEDQRARYARGLAGNLRVLGVSASVDEGDERFVVTASVDGPHSVHYVHDTFCECTLEASAEWEGSGLPRIALTQYGCGDEEEGDCVDNCVRDGVHRAARAVIVAWASSP